MLDAVVQMIERNRVVRLRTEAGLIIGDWIRFEEEFRYGDPYRRDEHVDVASASGLVYSTDVNTAAIATPPGDTTDPSLSPSLIQLRPETFGAHHADRATQLADPLDLRRTQPHKLGKRVGDRPTP